MTRLIVSGDTATSASATARRAVTGLSETSTIRGRPPRSTWDSRRRSARGCGRLVHRLLRVDRVVIRRWRTSWPVEPPQLDLGAGRQRIVASGTTARASAAARAEMTWLPCPPARRTQDAARGRRGPAPGRVALGLDAQERPPAVALA